MPAATSVGTARAPMLLPSFFSRPAQTVAPDLLGATLCVQQGGRVQRARIVETEAYVGPHDLACHAAKGITRRTRVLYGPAGRTYVYLVYGMHHLFNAVTGPEGDGQAVLVRAAEPMGSVAGRLDGPGRLTRTLGITVQQDNDVPLDGGRIWFERGTAPDEIATTARIGVDYAGEWAEAPLRFVDPGSAHLSVPLPRR